MHTLNQSVFKRCVCVHASTMCAACLSHSRVYKGVQHLPFHLLQDAACACYVVCLRLDAPPVLSLRIGCRPRYVSSVSVSRGMPCRCNCLLRLPRDPSIPMLPTPTAVASASDAKTRPPMSISFTPTFPPPLPFTPNAATCQSMRGNAMNAARTS